MIEKIEHALMCLQTIDPGYHRRSSEPALPMTTTSSVLPLLRPLRVLADHRGQPAALLLDLHMVMGVALPDAQLAELAANMTCLYRAPLAPEQAAQLDAAGWQRLDPARLARMDQAFDPASVQPGTTWVDGDWYLGPPPRAAGAQAASRALALQLVQLVAADADTHEIEALLRRDPGLSYQLLRLVNSLGVGPGRKIASFAQALMILGRQQLRRWLNLMLFATRGDDPRSAMLLARVAVRARMLELLAKERGLDKNTQELAFMTGMFSLLGVLFGMPLAEVLAPLSLSEGVVAALLRGEGELGALLAEAAALTRVDALTLDAFVWMQAALRESAP